MIILQDPLNQVSLQIKGKNDVDECISATKICVKSFLAICGDLGVFKLNDREGDDAADVVGKKRSRAADLDSSSEDEDALSLDELD